MLAISNFNNHNIFFFKASAYNQSITIDKIVDEIEKAKTIAIFPHINPDLDALGSAAALACAIKTKYPTKQVKAYLTGDISKSYNPFINSYPDIFQERNENVSISKPDLAIAVDCDELGRLGKANSELFRQAKTKIKIDHHSGREQFGEHNFVDTNATANTQLVLKVIERMNVKIDKNIARAVYAGIVTDTDGFKVFKGKPAWAFRDTAKLCEVDFDINSLNNIVYGMSRSQFEAYRDMVKGTKSNENGRITWFVDEKKTRPTSSTYLGMLNQINGVDAAVRFTPDKKSSIIHVSLRTNNNKIDLSNIAKELSGGGGHKNRAAFAMPGDMRFEEIIKKIQGKLPGS